MVAVSPAWPQPFQSAAQGGLPACLSQGSAVGDMTGLKLKLLVGVIAQLGERTTEDRKVPCSIHGNPTAHAVPGLLFFQLQCIADCLFHRAGKCRLCSQSAAVFCFTSGTVFWNMSTGTRGNPEILGVQGLQKIQA